MLALIRCKKTIQKVVLSKANLEKNACPFEEKRKATDRPNRHQRTTKETPRRNPTQTSKERAEVVDTTDAGAPACVSCSFIVVLSVRSTRRWSRRARDEEREDREESELLFAVVSRGCRANAKGRDEERDRAIGRQGDTSVSRSVGQ